MQTHELHNMVAGIESDYSIRCAAREILSGEATLANWETRDHGRIALQVLAFMIADARAVDAEGRAESADARRLG